MRIKRVYNVRIRPELREEFEPLFQSVARAFVADASGCLRVVVGWPTDASPDEYAMISDWNIADSLTRFIGPDWGQAHSPDGMEHFVDTAWVHHFRHADQPDA